MASGCSYVCLQSQSLKIQELEMSLGNIVSYLPFPQRKDEGTRISVFQPSI